MPKTTIVTCDSCGGTPDPNKNFLMVSGAMIKFGVNGPQRILLDQYYCSDCSYKILQAIEKINESERTDSGA